MKLLSFECVSCFVNVSGSFLLVCLSDIDDASLERLILSFGFGFYV